MTLHVMYVSHPYGRPVQPTGRVLYVTCVGTPARAEVPLQTTAQAGLCKCIWTAIIMYVLVTG